MSIFRVSSLPLDHLDAVAPRSVCPIQSLITAIESVNVFYYRRVDIHVASKTSSLLAEFSGIPAERRETSLRPFSLQPRTQTMIWQEHFVTKKTELNVMNR